MIRRPSLRDSESMRTAFIPPACREGRASALGARTRDQKESRASSPPAGRFIPTPLPAQACPLFAVFRPTTGAEDYNIMEMRAGWIERSQIAAPARYPPLSPAATAGLPAEVGHPGKWNGWKLQACEVLHYLLPDYRRAWTSFYRPAAGGIGSYFRRIKGPVPPSNTPKPWWADFQRPERCLEIPAAPRCRS